jgi:hypothetical protein
VLGAVFVAVILSTPGGVTPAAGEPVIPAATFVDRIARGERIDETDIRIEGEIDLVALGQIKQALRCNHCHVTGGVRAADVTFEQMVDLTDVTIDGDVDLRGSTFEGPAFFTGTTAEGARLEGAVDLTSAVFKDVASFQGARIGGRYSAVGTRFAADASFTSGHFLQPVNFERATFGGRAQLNDVVFGAGVSFLRATFVGHADLSVSASCDSVVLRSSAFAVLDMTGFAVGNLAGAACTSAPPRPKLEVTNASGGTLDLQKAVTPKLDLNGLRISSVIDLRELEATELVWNNVTTAGLRAAPESLDGIQSVSNHMDGLTALEDTARRAGDLRTANDARYARLGLASERQPWWRRLPDIVLYRWIAGYLVRPSHPINTFVLLVLAGAVARVVRRARRNVLPPRVTTTTKRTGAAGALLWGIGVGLTALIQAARGALARKPKNMPTVDEFGRVRDYVSVAARGFEYLSGKALLFVFGLCLGNSNATLRQLIDALVY